MEVTLKLENLEHIVKTTLNENLETVITDAVKSLAEEEVQKTAKDIIGKIVSREISKYIREYIETATLTIGGGWGELPKTYTVKEYLQNQVNECIEKQTFKVKGDYSNSTKTIKFEDFVKNHIDINKEIEKKLKGFANDIRKDVSANINQIFTQATQSTLSETVLQVLMATETYQNITNQVKRIADGNNNN